MGTTYNGSSPYQTPGIMSIPHLEQSLALIFLKTIPDYKESREIS